MEVGFGFFRMEIEMWLCVFNDRFVLFREENEDILR